LIFYFFYKEEGDGMIFKHYQKIIGVLAISLTFLLSLQSAQLKESLTIFTTSMQTLERSIGEKEFVPKAPFEFFIGEYLPLAQEQFLKSVGIDVSYVEFYNAPFVLNNLSQIKSWFTPYFSGKVIQKKLLAAVSDIGVSIGGDVLNITDPKMEDKQIQRYVPLSVWSGGSSLGALPNNKRSRKASIISKNIPSRTIEIDSAQLKTSLELPLAEAQVANFAKNRTRGAEVREENGDSARKAAIFHGPIIIGVVDSHHRLVPGLARILPRTPLAQQWFDDLENIDAVAANKQDFNEFVFNFSNKLANAKPWPDAGGSLYSKGGFKGSAEEKAAYAAQLKEYASNERLYLKKKLGDDDNDLKFWFNSKKALLNAIKANFSPFNKILVQRYLDELASLLSPEKKQKERIEKPVPVFNPATVVSAPCKIKLFVKTADSKKSTSHYFFEGVINKDTTYGKIKKIENGFKKLFEEDPLNNFELLIGPFGVDKNNNVVLKNTFGIEGTPPIVATTALQREQAIKNLLSSKQQFSQIIANSKLGFDSVTYRFAADKVIHTGLDSVEAQAKAKRLNNDAFVHNRREVRKAVERKPGEPGVIIGEPTPPTTYETVIESDPLPLPIIKPIIYLTAFDEHDAPIKSFENIQIRDKQKIVPSDTSTADDQEGSSSQSEILGGLLWSQENAEDQEWVKNLDKTSQETELIMKIMNAVEHWDPKTNIFAIVNPLIDQLEKFTVYSSEENVKKEQEKLVQTALRGLKGLLLSMVHKGEKVDEYIIAAIEERLMTIVAPQVVEEVFDEEGD